MTVYHLWTIGCAGWYGEAPRSSLSGCGSDLDQVLADHERLVYKYQGRRFRLTDVHGETVRDILA